MIKRHWRNPKSAGYTGLTRQLDPPSPIPMRWYWIDRFIDFQSGHQARAIKQITLAEEHLHDHFREYPVMPNSLVVEGMGQTSMFLAWEAIQYSQLVLLAKITGASFHFPALPGDTLIYTATLNSVKNEGISVTATSHKNDQLQGNAELLFVRFTNERTDGRSAAFLSLAESMRTLGAFAIGQTADGSRLSPPAILNVPVKTR